MEGLWGPEMGGCGAFSPQNSPNAYNLPLKMAPGYGTLGIGWEMLFQTKVLMRISSYPWKWATACVVAEASTAATLLMGKQVLHSHGGTQ